MKRSRVVRWVFAGEEFTSKEAVFERLRGILQKSKMVGAPIEGQDKAVVEAVFAEHPNAAKKFSTGIKKLYAAKDFYGNRCFRIVLNSGLDTDVSFRKCLNHPGPKQYYMEAARFEVRDQIVSFRNAQFDSHPRILCPYTGEVLTPTSCHVDHTAPMTFDKISLDFLQKEGLKMGDVRLHLSRPGVEGARFVDEELGVRWRAYHKEKAVLRLLSRQGNLIYARKGK